MSNMRRGFDRTRLSPALEGKATKRSLRTWATAPLTDTAGTRDATHNLELDARYQRHKTTGQCEIAHLSVAALLL